MPRCTCQIHKRNTIRIKQKNNVGKKKPKPKPNPIKKNGGRNLKR